MKIYHLSMGLVGFLFATQCFAEVVCPPQITLVKDGIYMKAKVNGIILPTNDTTSNYWINGKPKAADYSIRDGGILTLTSRYQQAYEGKFYYVCEYQIPGGKHPFDTFHVNAAGSLHP